MRYVVSGLTMLDVIRFPDGSLSVPQMGGIPMYGYCGMRPYTDSICFFLGLEKIFGTPLGLGFPVMRSIQTVCCLYRTKRPMTLLHTVKMSL